MLGLRRLLGGMLVSSSKAVIQCNFEPARHKKVERVNHVVLGVLRGVGVVGTAGGVGWGYSCGVCSKTQCSKPLARGQFSRVASELVLNLGVNM